MAAAETYVLFQLAGTAYAVRSQDVERMEMVETVTPVPNAPPFVDGLVFSRGKVVPAVNLRRRFGFDAIPYDLTTRMIVVGVTGRSVALIVDSAREFVTIPREAIQPPPDGVSGTTGNSLAGIATLNGKVILILDLPELLNQMAALPR